MKFLPGTSLLRAYVGKCSNKNVDFMEFAPGVIDPTDIGRYVLLCKQCGTQMNIVKTVDPDWDRKEILSCIDQFSPEHTHNLADELQKLVEDPPKEVEIMGQLIVYPGGRHRDISVTQETLKLVAKMSNFNVDLQARMSSRGNEYRARCTKCFAEDPIDWETFDPGQQGEAWVALGIFCNRHRHDPAAVEPEGGRRFRHAEREGSGL